jgi:outer membrane lipoprotein-sorting protein
MRHLRTLPTNRLIVAAAAVIASLAGLALLAVAATGSGDATPAPASLPDAIHQALAAPAVDGVTARVTFTNRLFPSGALLGSAGPVLMSGGSGRLWVTNDGRGRLELQSNDGDAQIVWNKTAVTVYDASSNTVYTAALPHHESDTTATPPPPSLAQVTDVLARIGEHVLLSGADPTDIAGQPAYSVMASPKQTGGLLDSVELAWDATHGIPLRVGVYAKGSSAPVLELAADDVSFGAVSSGTVDIAPPADAKVVDLGTLSPGGTASGGGSSAEATGLANVQAAVDFPVTAPGSLGGRPRRDVRLVGGGDSKAALVVYGEGPGAIAVVERHADASSKSPFANLPTVTLDGRTAHELATPLGTVVGWTSNGVSLTLAGSVTSAAAEAAVGELG